MDRKQKTIMAVGAHIGDVQLTCGLLLAKHAMAGDKVVIVNLTAGERGTPQGMATEDFRVKNIADAKAFAETLGGIDITLDTPDGELVHSQDAAITLADIMREYAVDTVLGHWKSSLHKDHIAAYQLTVDAIFFASLPTFERPIFDTQSGCLIGKKPPAPIHGIYYAENWEDAEGFEPYIFVDVTEAFPLWRDAVKKLWLTENSRDFKYLRYYEALSIMRGALIRRDHAVALGVDAYARRHVQPYV